MSIILGVTGGIASGKSTVSEILNQKFNSVVLSADNIAKEVMQKNSIIELIKNAFGNYDILDENHNIDSKKLSKIVFNDDKMLKTLNSIVHPVVMENIKNRISALQEYDFIILDVPIPIIEFIRICDYIIVVLSDTPIRINRIIERNHLSEEDAILRIKSQLSNEEYKELADFIVYNNSDYNSLVINVEAICKFLK